MTLCIEDDVNRPQYIIIWLIRNVDSFDAKKMKDIQKILPFAMLFVIGMFIRC